MLGHEIEGENELLELKTGMPGCFIPCNVIDNSLSHFVNYNAFCVFFIDIKKFDKKRKIPKRL